MTFFLSEHQTFCGGNHNWCGHKLPTDYCWTRVTGSSIMHTMWKKHITIFISPSLYLTPLIIISYGILLQQILCRVYNVMYNVTLLHRFTPNQNQCIGVLGFGENITFLMKDKWEINNTKCCLWWFFKGRMNLYLLNTLTNIGLVIDIE